MSRPAQPDLKADKQDLRLLAEDIYTVADIIARTPPPPPAPPPGSASP